MDNITIPPEAEEVAAQYLWAERYPRLPWSDANSSARIEFRAKARAAIGQPADWLETKGAKL